MAKLETKTKDNPKLEQRVMKDGRISLYLEYYIGRKSEPILNEYGDPVLYESGEMKGKPKYKVTHIRKKENLPYYLVAKPRTPMEKEENKRLLKLAQDVRKQREEEFLENKTGCQLKKPREADFLDYFQTYIDNYKKKDIKVLKGALRRFKDFLKDTPEYSIYATSIKPDQLNKDMMEAFTEYLQSRSKGEGAKTLYARFKKVVNYAVEHGEMKASPCKGVTITIDPNRLRKDVLSVEEVQAMMTTHYKGENPDIRRAFIFSLYTGVRFCDVKELTFADVDYANKFLNFEQNKTKGHSKNSGVETPLNDGLLELIGKPTDGQTRDSLIFPLPTHAMCCKALGRWAKRAGIDKHITWHCARHSFAVNILNNGANIKTVASLLGHSDLKNTEKYTRAVDRLKRAAIDSLPELNM